MTKDNAALLAGGIRLASGVSFLVAPEKANRMQRSTMVPLKVFDVDDALRTINEEAIDVVPGPPTLYSSLLEHPSLASASLKLRLAVTGAAVVPEALVKRMRTELGFEEVITAYGLTE